MSLWNLCSNVSRGLLGGKTSDIAASLRTDVSEVVMSHCREAKRKVGNKDCFGLGGSEDEE